MPLFCDSLDEAMIDGPIARGDLLFGIVAS